MINIFLATDLDISNLNTNKQGKDEMIEKIEKVHINDIKQMIVDGKIKCGLTIASLNFFFLQKDDNLL